MAAFFVGEVIHKNLLSSGMQGEAAKGGKLHLFCHGGVSGESGFPPMPFVSAGTCRRGRARCRHRLSCPPAARLLEENSGSWRSIEELATISAVRAATCAGRLQRNTTSLRYSISGHADCCLQ